MKTWDPRVLKIFCEHGLRELPTAEYADQKTGVTLKCHRMQEAASYRSKSRIVAYNYLHSACKLLPIHVIYGAIDDHMCVSHFLGQSLIYNNKSMFSARPAVAKEDTIKNAAKGLLASAQKVEGAGHLVVQTHPKGLAGEIYTALAQDHGTAAGSQPSVSSKL